MPHGGSGHGPSKGPSTAKKGIGGACHAPSKPVDNVPTALEPIVISNSSTDIMCPELFEACRAGKVERVRRLLSHEGVSGTATDFYGKTCLHSACFAGQEKVAEALLEELPTLLTQNADDGTTPLMSACEMGQLRLVRFLLEKKVDPHAATKDGTTALMKASERGSLECVEFLLQEAEVDVNCSNEEGFTALLYAAKMGRTPVVKSLLEAGADSSAKLLVGTSASALAQAAGHDSTVKALDMHAKLQSRKACRIRQGGTVSPPVDNRSLDDIMAEFEGGEQAAISSSKKPKKNKSKNACAREISAGTNADTSLSVDVSPSECLPEEESSPDASKSAYQKHHYCQELAETCSIPVLTITCKLLNEESAEKVDNILKKAIQATKPIVPGVLNIERMICKSDSNYVLSLKFDHAEALAKFLASDARKNCLGLPLEQIGNLCSGGQSGIEFREFSAEKLL